MNVIQLKERLSDNVDDIIKILEDLGCGKITYSRYTNEVRSAIDDGFDSNPNSIRIKPDTLRVTSFSDRFKFDNDIIAFVMERKGCAFIDAIKYICKSVGIEFDGITVSKPYQLFGGYFYDIKREYNIGDIDIPTYNDNILEEFIDMPNKMFLKDGISLQTQADFNIMYDIFTNRITVPWRNSCGEICGVTGRWNGGDYELHNEPKWKPVLPVLGFKKSHLLFGYSENYKYIQSDSIVFVAESEKSVLQAHTMGIKNFVAVGSHNISNMQIKLVHSLFPKQIVIAYDEDVEESILIEECKKIQLENAFCKVKVGYIYDEHRKYLQRGSKFSPTDDGINTLESLCKECLKWI